MKNKNEKNKKAPDYGLTVPKGTIITKDLLIWRDKYPVWEVFTRWFAFFILAIFPLVVLNLAKDSDGVWIAGFKNSYWYYNMTELKRTVFRVMTLIYVAACGIGLAYYVYDERVRRTRISFNKATGCLKLTWPQIFLLGYVAWGIISVISALIGNEYDFLVLWRGYSAADVKYGIRTEGLFHLLLYSVIFIFLSFWGEYSEKYYWGMSVMSLIFCGIAILQFCGVNLFYPSDNSFKKSGFLSTMGNVDMVGALGAVVVPALFCIFIFYKSRKRYMALVGFSLMNFVTLVAGPDSYRMGLLGGLAIALPFLFDTKDHSTDSLWGFSALFASTCLGLSIDPRANEIVHFSKVSIGVIVLAALCAAAAYLLSRTAKREWKFSPRTMRIGIALTLVAGIVAVLIFLFVYDKGSGLLHEIHEVLHFRMDDKLGNGRGYAWKATFQIIKENWFFGAGPGTYFYEFNPRFTTSVSFDMPHNDFLQVAAHTGIVGLALYLAFLGTLVARTIKAAKRSSLIIPIAASVASYLIHSFFSFSIAIVTPMFWVSAGLLDKWIRQMPTEVDPVLADES